MKKTYIFLLLVVIVFGCDKDVSITPPMEEPQKGYVYVSSYPTGAKIYLNGKNTGKVTPDSLTYVEYGATEVILKRDYFNDYTFNFELVEGERKNLYVDYSAMSTMYGSLSLASVPVGCNIYIDDSLTTLTTPAEISRILAGKYNIRYSTPGYRDCEISASVYSNKKTNITYSLQDTTVWLDYKITNSEIPSNNLSCIAIDKNQRIFVGTGNAGIGIFNRVEWSYLTTSNSILPSDNIICLDSDDAGNVWIGTEQGLLRYNSSGLKLYTRENSDLPNNTIRDIAVGNNEVWIATYSGLVKFSNEKFTTYNTSNSDITSNSISAVGVSSNGIVYVGTVQEGLILKSGDYFMKIDSPLGIYVTTIKVDKNNIAWVGYLPTLTASGGLAYYQNNTLNNYSGKLSSRAVRSICGNLEQFVWLGTDDGLVQVDAQFVSTIYKAATYKLTSSLIKGVQVDANNVLWIATEGGGLCRFIP